MNVVVVWIGVSECDQKIKVRMASQLGEEAALLNCRHLQLADQFRLWNTCN